MQTEWSGYPDPADPDNFWIDDETGERVSAKTGEREPLTKRFPAGARVATHPATDAWMRGERFGTVTRTSRRGVPKVYVRLDASGRVRPFHPDNVIPQE